MSARRFVFIFAILSFGATACIRHVPARNDQDVTEAFGIVVADAALDTTQVEELSPKLKTDAQGNVVFDSREWLDSARRMFDAAEALKDSNFYEGRLRLIKTANDLAQAFYSSSNATLPMTPTAEPAGNPFVEEAYFFVKDILNQQYRITMTNAAKRVDQAASMVKVPKLGPFGDAEIDMNQVIDLPIHALENFVKNLRQLDDDTTKEVTEEISARIQKEYLSELQKFKAALKTTGVRETALSYVARLRSTIKASPLIPEENMPEINKGLDLVTYYARKIEATQDQVDVMHTFIDLWIAKDNRAKFPSSVRQRVAEAFKPYKDQEIVALTNNNADKLLDEKRFGEMLRHRDQLVAAIADDPATAKYAQSLADKLFDPAKKRDLVFTAIVSEWYNMDFRGALSDLKDLWRFSENDLLLIRNEKDHLFPTHAVLAIARKKILDSIKNFQTPFPNSGAFQPGMDWFKGYVNYQIIHAIQKEIANAIVEVAETIPEKIRVAIKDSLSDLKLKSRENVWDLFKQYSGQYLKKWIFESKSNLPLLEKTKLKFSYENHQLVPLPSENETSAEMLGLGLTTAVQRLGALEYLDLKPDTPTARALSFQSLCKLAALSGYTGIDGKQVPSLMAPFTPKKRIPPLDLEKYDPDVETYAAADSIPIKQNYKIASLSTKHTKASVRGQMELLAGLTKLLRYLKPWSPTSFDIGMQALRADEFPTQVIFPKDTFFLQSLGLSATIIKNLPSRMLELIGLDDQVYPFGSVKDVSSLQLGGAVVADFDSENISHVIKTHDIAVAIITLNDFLDAINDLTRSSDKTVRAASTELDAQRPLLEKLFLGMSMFSLSKLMASDGGFVVGYDMDALAPSSEPRQLSDQLLMQEAMLVIGNILNRNFIRIKAIDNFFFLNRFFWNNRLGFYNQSEADVDGHVKLSDVAEALRNTVLLKPLLKTLAVPNPALRPSVQQLEELQKFWLTRFFGEKTSNLVPVLKLANFVPPPEPASRPAAQTPSNARSGIKDSDDN